MIGIDRYRAWGRLERAVNDARGARDTFAKLGFQEFRPPLFDDDATGAALRCLVTDELRSLGTDDSLVLFFAGHGHTVTTAYCDGTVTKRGYLLPVDAEHAGPGIGSWVSIDSWLHDVAHLPPRHILVIVDACHSGIALNPVIRWRGEDVRTGEPLAKLAALRSRRIITSALDSELAMDSGPIEGHSLFTGCLIEALTGGMRAKTSQATATGSEIALHVQRRVASFPGGRQTPDFGALELDNRGELIIEFPGAAPEAHPVDLHLGVDGIMPRRHSGTGPPVPECDAGLSAAAGATAGAGSPPPGSGVDSIRPRRARTAPPTVEPPDKPAPTPGASAFDPAAIAAAPRARAVGTGAPARDAGNQTPGRAPSRVSPAHAAFVSALDQHQAERQRGGRVLSLVTADPMTGMMGWASWAASRGHLTIATEATGLAASTASLLDQVPWLRLLRPARARLAAVARLEPGSIDAELDARASVDREAWVGEVAGHDLHARVSGWLLSLVREPWGRMPDLTTAPVQGGDLLAALCELAAPITVLLHHADPTLAWLERAIQTAAELVEFVPGRAIAVSAPHELITALGRSHADSAALALARRGEVPLAGRMQRAVDAGRSGVAQLLHAALARDPRTAGLFEPAASVPTHERSVEVDLIARDALLAIEIDDWYLLRDPKAYLRDRIKDVWLSRAQFFVMRFLVEDVEERIEQIVEEVALGLAGRRASGSFVEN